VVKDQRIYLWSEIVTEYGCCLCASYCRITIRFFNNSQSAFSVPSFKVFCILLLFCSPITVGVGPTICLYIVCLHPVGLAYAHNWSEAEGRAVSVWLVHKEVMSRICCVDTEAARPQAERSRHARLKSFKPVIDAPCPLAVYCHTFVAFCVLPKTSWNFVMNSCIRLVVLKWLRSAKSFESCCFIVNKITSLFGFPFQTMFIQDQGSTFCNCDSSIYFGWQPDMCCVINCLFIIIISK